MRSLRSLTLNSSLAVVSVLLTGLMIFAVGEAFFRIMIGGLPIDPPAGWFQFHSERGWSLVPGRYSYFHTAAFREVAVELNDLGTRNGPLSMVPEKPRLSILGDSFTFADALNEDEKFTQVLQGLVGEETEIVNISVPGYGTGQQMLLLEELVKQGYHPGETVVLVFFTNDILDNVGLNYGKAEPNPRKPVFYTDTDGALKYRKPEDPGDRSGSNSTKTKLLFLRFLNYRAEILAAENPWLLKVLSYVGYAPTLPRTPGVINGWYIDGWHDRWLVTKKILETIQRRVGGYGDTELVIAFIPSPVQVEPVFEEMLKPYRQDPAIRDFYQNPGRPQQVLREFCADNNIRFIDTTAALRAEPTGGPAYFPREGHLNVLGSRIVGQRIFDFLYGDTD